MPLIKSISGIRGTIGDRKGEDLTKEDIVLYTKSFVLWLQSENRIINNKIVVIGNSSVYHLGGGTLNDNSSFKYYLNFRNSIIMLVKNLPKRMLFISLFGRFLTDLLILVFSILTLRFNVFFGLIRAYSYLTINVFKLKREKSNNEYYKFYYCKSIFYNYFFRSKKIFSKI